jgi:hypothetical protein
MDNERVDYAVENGIGWFAPVPLSDFLPLSIDKAVGILAECL